MPRSLRRPEDPSSNLCHPALMTAALEAIAQGIPMTTALNDLCDRAGQLIPSVVFCILVRTPAAEGGMGRRTLHGGSLLPEPLHRQLGADASSVALHEQAQACGFHLRAIETLATHGGTASVYAIHALTYTAPTETSRIVASLALAARALLHQRGPAVTPTERPAVLAHDLNNVLAAILGYIDLARDAAEPGSLVASRLREAAGAVQHAQDFSKRLGSERVDMETVDIHPVVSETERLSRAVLPGNVTLEVNVAANLPSLRANRMDLQRVLFNLVLNAIEAIGAQPGHVQIKAARRALDVPLSLPGPAHTRLLPGAYLCITISDDGPGVPAAVLPRMFQPYVSSKAEDSVPHGLGLSSALQVVQRHGGGIGIETGAGIGTVFSIYLPLGATRTTALSERLVVLIAESDPDVRAITAAMVGSLGHATLEAADSSEALALFQQMHDDIGLVLFDLLLPGMEGAQVALRLRAFAPHVPLISSSGLSREELPASLQAIIGGHLRKPYGLAELRAALDAVMHASHGSAVHPLRRIGAR